MFNNSFFLFAVFRRCRIYIPFGLAFSGIQNARTEGLIKILNTAVWILSTTMNLIPIAI